MTTRRVDGRRRLHGRAATGLIGLAALATVHAAGAAAPAGEVRALVGNHLGFSARDWDALERGEPIKRSLDASDPREVALAGAIRVQVPRAYVVDRIRNIADFKRGPLVLQVGTFSDPPRVEDVDSLTLPPEDLADLRHCRPGDCNVKLPAATIERLRAEVDWAAPDASARATRIVREMIVERARLHLRSGVSALPPYHARSRPVFVSRELAGILDASPYLTHYAPELRSFVEAFPRIGLPASEDFLYWSKETFELKPVISLTHLALYTPPRYGSTLTIVASVGLYASHYVDASLGLTVVADAEAATDACDLIYINRTRVDALAGAFAGLRRWTAERRARAGLEDQLRGMKQRLERDYRASAGRRAGVRSPSAAERPRR